MSCVQPDYMSSQGDINEKMRAILIDWLIEVEKHMQTQNHSYLLVDSIFEFDILFGVLPGPSQI